MPATPLLDRPVRPITSLAPDEAANILDRIQRILYSRPDEGEEGDLYDPDVEWTQDTIEEVDSVLVEAGLKPRATIRVDEMASHHDLSPQGPTGTLLVAHLTLAIRLGVGWWLRGLDDDTLRRLVQLDGNPLNGDLIDRFLVDLAPLVVPGSDLDHGLWYCRRMHRLPDVLIDPATVRGELRRRSTV